MKIKTTIIAITSALYASGVAANVHSSEVKPQAIDLMELYNVQKEAADNSSRGKFLSPLRNGALNNIQFTPKSVNNKNKNRERINRYSYLYCSLNR